MEEVKTNRVRLKALRAELGLTQTEAAQLLAIKTMRPCSLRTVQAWEADPVHHSARNCPDWAIVILTEVREHSKH